MSTPSVNITTQLNTISVDSSGAITKVTATTAGPQGPSFSSTGTTMVDASKVDKSIVYYDATAGSYKADTTWTTDTLTDGGNW